MSPMAEIPTTLGSDTPSPGNHESKRIPRLKTLASLFTVVVSCMLLTQSSASCSLPTDYRNLIGATEANVEPAYSAPNDLGDLVVAGTYYTIQSVIVGYTYLWQESSCSYLWEYQYSDIKYLYAASWSHDQRSSVYVLGYIAAILPARHFITVFHDPYNDSVFGMGEPFTYAIDLGGYHLIPPILENGSGLIGLPTDGYSQHGRLARALIVSNDMMQVFYVGKGYQGAKAYEMHVHDDDVILHAVVNASGDKLFTLTASTDGHEHMKVRKFDTATMASEGAEMDFFATWTDNDAFTNEGYGRIGVHQSGSTDTLFVATSQIGVKGVDNVHQILDDQHHDNIELVRMTFTDDSLACGLGNSDCKRYAVSPWKKVLAIAPVSATSAHYLLAVPHITDEKALTGNLEIQLFTVDFSSEEYTQVSQSSQFTTFVFYSTLEVFTFFDTYDLPHLVARPYFGAPGSTTLEDFYLTVCLQGLPGSTWELDGSRVTTTMTLLNDRQTSFFDPETSGDLPDSEDFNPTELNLSNNLISIDHRRIERMFNDGALRNNRLVHFNAIMGQQLSGHSFVPAARTVHLNNAPIFAYTDVYVRIGVGQYLTESFVYYEYENNKPLSLVSLEYSFNPGGKMPEPASDFYYVDPENESIQSKTYLENHIGDHNLNVTVADSLGAQSSIVLKVHVSHHQVPEEEIISATEVSTTSTVSNEITSFLDHLDEQGDDILDDLEELADILDDDDDELPYCDELHNGGGKDTEGPHDKPHDGKSGGGAPGGGAPAGGAPAGGAPAEGGQGGGRKRRMFACRNREESSDDQVAESSVAQTPAFVFDASQYHLANGCISDKECEKEKKQLETKIADVEVTVDGTVIINFSSDVSFLRDLCREIEGCVTSTAKSTRNLQEKEKNKAKDSEKNVQDQWNSLVANTEISLIRDSIVQEDVEFEWTIVEVGFDYMKILVTWTDPAEVSSGDSVDQLYLKIDARSLNIDSFASVFEYTVSVPKQQIEVIEEEEEDIGVPASVVSGLATTAATSIFRLVMVGALSQLWGLINGLSLFVHLPLLASDGLCQKKTEIHKQEIEDLQEADSDSESEEDQEKDKKSKGHLEQLEIYGECAFDVDYDVEERKFDQQGISIPESTLDILGYLITVAQFDIVENELVYGGYVPFEPERDDLQRENFYLTGYESNYAMVNMGTNLLILPIVFFFIFLLIVCLPIRNSKSWSGRKHRKCSKEIFWNFWLRLLIQGCLEILCASGPYLMDRKQLLDESENGYNSYFILNDILSISLTVVLFIMPIWVLIFYCCKFERLSEEKFKDKWGSAYDGLNPKKRSSIFYPVYFLVRRILFLTFILGWKDSTSLKIFANIFMTMIAAIYLIVFKPFATKLLQGLEVFNEFTSLVLLSLVLGWTNFGLKEREKEIVGYVFNSCMGVNISVHLYFLLRTVCRQCTKKCEKKKEENNIDKQVDAEKAQASTDKSSKRKKRQQQNQPDFVNEPDRTIRRQKIMSMVMSQISEEPSENQESDRLSGQVVNGRSAAPSGKKLLIDTSNELSQRQKQPRTSPITIKEHNDRIVSNRNIPVRRQLALHNDYSAPEPEIVCEQTEHNNVPIRQRRNDRTNLDPEPEPELLYAVHGEVDDNDIFVAGNDREAPSASDEQQRRKIVAGGPIGARLLANEDEHESQSITRLQVPEQIKTKPRQGALQDDFDINEAYDSFVVNSIAGGSSNLQNLTEESKR